MKQIRRAHQYTRGAMYRGSRSILLVVLCLVFSSVLQSQKPLQFSLPGCPGGTINVLSQDADGLILAGTARGLYQYDGQVWTAVFPDSVELRDITAIAHDRSGNCWVGNRAGEVWKKGRQTDWKAFAFGNYLNEAPITGIHCSDSDELWIATYGGGIFYREENELINIRREDGLPDDQVYSISLDPAGRCWAATDVGLASCFWYKDSLRVRSWTPKDGLTDLMMFEVVADSEGNVFAAGFEGGVNVMYADSLNRFTPLVSDWEAGPVRKLASRPDGRVYAAPEEGGLIKIFDGGRQFEYEKGRISSLLIDREGNLWTAFYGGELRRAFTPLEVIPMPEGIEVHAVELGPEGNIWAGCSEGLCRYDVASQSWKCIATPAGIHIISLMRIYNTLWIGTFGQGLFTYDFNTGALKPFARNNELPDKNILSMSTSKPGIYLATLGGLARITHINHEVVPPGVQGLPESYIYQAIPQGADLWVASDGKGLFHSQISPDTTESIPVFEGKTVYSIYNNQGSIWAATESGELYHQTENGFVPVSTYEAGPFTCLQGDQQGNVLAIGNARCNWYDAEGNFLMGLGEAQGTHVENRNLNASTYDHRGGIWAAAGDRVLCAWPLEENQQIKPRAWLREVSVLLQPIDKYNVASLRHDENHLSFSYGATWYQSGEELGYRYRLRGYNMDWVYSGNTNAIFPKLVPGEYTFEVQAGLNGHFEKSETISFQFSIKKPWWKETWFITLSIIGVSLLVLLWLEVRERRLKKIARLEQEKISFQLEMLRQQINPHFLFNSLNTLLDMVEEGQQKEAIGYIERLSDLFRSVLTLRDQSVISLKEEIDLANRFYSLQKNRYGDKLGITFSEMPAGKYIPPLTVQLLIENAIKHNEVSRRMPLLIEVFLGEDGKLTVRNNLQKRRTPASSTGTGLHNIISRYEVLTNKTVEVEESEDYFTVRVPLLDDSHPSG